MPIQPKSPRFVKRSTDILLIAPHGVKTKPKNDFNTDILAESIRDKLKCSALINDSIRKNVCDYNVRNDAEKDKTFIKYLRSVLDAEGSTLVVWIHGIGTKSMGGEKTAMGHKGRLDCLIGFGQPDRHSIPEPRVDSFIDLLSKNGLIARKTRNDADDFRGRSTDYMNQWCQQQKKYKDLDKIQSVQLEFSGGSRKKKVIEKTAEAVFMALSALVRPIVDETEKPEIKTDDALANEAFEYLKDLFRRHFHEAMLEAGQYIIEKFYNGDYKLAQKKPSGRYSLRQLIQRLQNNSGHAPSKTWVYDAVNLAIDEHLLSSFRTYGNIGHSHKVLLTHVPEMGTKKLLIKETDKKKHTIARLRERIKETSQEGLYISIDRVPDDETLEPLELKKLESLRDDLNKRIASYTKKLDQYNIDKARVEKFIKFKQN